MSKFTQRTRPSRPRKHGFRSEEGTVVVLAAIMAVVVIGFAALVVDIGMLATAKSELQNAMDAAALAGAAKLLEKDYDAARSLAVEFAGHNTILGQPLTLDPTTGVGGGRVGRGGGRARGRRRPRGPARDAC